MKKESIRSKAVEWALVGAAAAILGTAKAAPQRVDSIPTVTYRIRGLRAPAEILVDKWGVPHIYARNFYDVFFAQGFNAARDRLWQLDLWRRRGEGLLSEAFGAHFLEKDRAARLFLYRGDMHAEWLAYSSDTKRVVTSFVEGVNEYIRLTRKKAQMLPPEFKLLGYQPALWTPETVVRIRSHGLSRNVSREVARAEFLRDHGREALSLRDRLEPSHNLRVPEGLDLSLVTDDVLDVYRLATGEVRFPEELSQKLLAPTSPREAVEIDRFESRTTLDVLAGMGSNNWAVAPSRSATGRAILANDPHRRQSVPSLRYIVHLSTPGLDVIGAGEPALPGISIGHNDRVAFGLTIFAIDQEDLYVYRTNPQSLDEYWYQGRWEPMRIVRDTIPVRDARVQEVIYKFTRHGPVVFEDSSRQLAIAVKCAWLEPGMAPYLGSIEYMRARNWDQFLAAMNRWGAPSENQVYADIEGNIGWKPGGLAPIRPNWDGLLPVPGDGRYEWAGFHDMDELPVDYNPARGWLATANQMNLPPGYPHELGFRWAPPYRYQRISEVLQGAERVSFEDMLQLQTDYLSIPARRLVGALEGLKSRNPRVQRALAMLRSWDFSLETESAPAALFEIWYRRFLGPALLAKVVSDESLRKALGFGHPEILILLVERPDLRLGKDPVAARNEALVQSLSRAVEEAEKLLGKDWKAWQWGRLHHAAMEHPMAAFVNEKTRAQWNVGPVPRGGSGDTVGSTRYRLS
ncbi:MAG: penicillin acylase family protein, partial [Acidobacteriota bacterium]